ncbi:hypothetical protein CLV92_10589 [Kineococcus xinjiangensis]|uniref:DUF559 domain-containing protein n=1 Tax=Kineococcus xinjiangensis TaxID=512762 RepID=A0A2S6IP42_9ACTN|nr:hypothetical protein [Kineococcus xinjiangensis]PPK95989.1 hypothetical protein CLV92_10589 [Kineococcus xinjiangensis]
MDDTYNRPHRTAALLDRHLTRHDLRSPLWRRPHRGVRTWAGVPLDAAQRVREAAALLPPHGAVGGWAAALLHGAAGVDGEDAQGCPLPVPLCVGHGHALRRRPGIRLSASHLPPHEVQQRAGVRVTTPARTAFDVLRWAGSVREATAAADLLLRHELLPRADVLGLASERRRWEGAAQVRRALELSREGVLSPGETRLRLLWTLDAGLPEPLVNQRIEDRRGRLLGVADLLDPGSGLVAEYDGAHHRELGQHGRDNVREELFEAHGLVVVRAVSTDLGPDRARAVARLQAGHRRALALPPGGRGWVAGGAWRP